MLAHFFGNVHFYKNTIICKGIGLAPTLPLALYGIPYEIPRQSQQAVSAVD